MSQKIGKLGPVKEVLALLEEFEREQRELKGDDAELVRVVAIWRRRFEAALAEAEDPTLTVSIEDYARAKGITPGAAYQRFRRKQIPGARKDEANRIVIPAEALAA